MLKPFSLLLAFLALFVARSNYQILAGRKRNYFRDYISPVIGAVGADKSLIFR